MTTSVRDRRVIRDPRAVTFVAAAALLVLTPAHGLAAATPATGAPTDPGLDQTIDAGQRIVDGPAVLERGHVDIGPRYVDGAWTVLVHDDAARTDDDATSVWRSPDETVFRVGDEAILTVPDGEAYAFLGMPSGQEVHVVPQVQDPDVVWLGWNTQDPEVMSTIDRGVTMSLLGVEGPGDVVVYLQSGSFDEPDVLWDSRTVEPQPAWVAVNTHAHANWVFSDPGVYLARVEISAELVDGGTVSDTRDLRFAVGEDTATDDALAASSVEPAAPGMAGSDAAVVDGGAAAPPPSSGPDTRVVATIAAGVVLLGAAATTIALRGRRAKRQAITGSPS